MNVRALFWRILVFLAIVSLWFGYYIMVTTTLTEWTPLGVLFLFIAIIMFLVCGFITLVLIIAILK